MWYAFWMTNRWLLLNFEALGALSVLVTSLFAISTLKNDAGLAGVCITSAMSFTMSGMFLVYFFNVMFSTFLQCTGPVVFGQVCIP